MPMDKKVSCPASSSQQKTHRYSADKACAINNRRRDRYKQLSSDKKNALTRYRELSNQNLLSSSLTPLPNAQLRLTGQRGVTITEISPRPEIGASSRIDTSTFVPGKGKDIIGCLSIFEVGSTSAAPVEQHNPKATIAAAKGSASPVHQWYDPKATTEENKGGSGKTFLYRALLATIRSKGFIALATATSGVAVSILPGGRTTHSRFKIPINIDEQFSCNIMKVMFVEVSPPETMMCQHFAQLQHKTDIHLNQSDKQTMWPFPRFLPALFFFSYSALLGPLLLFVPFPQSEKIF